MDAKLINDLIGIKESYELPDKLMSILMDKQHRELIFNEFRLFNQDINYDCFRDYFQEEHADRKGLKQDYTPDCICKLLSGLRPETDRMLDVCSGTGALTIGSCNADGFYQLEEISSRSIPILLFNLAIRNLNAVVLQKNILTREVMHTYRLTKGENYSDIEEIEKYQEQKAPVILSNPPYSLEWVPIMDERFEGYELAPKAKADYAFVLDVVSRLNQNGKAFIILPHGVLFRGQAEGKIRQQLIENNLLEAIIGLPGNLFLNTQIPTLVMVINKAKKNKDVLIVDASKDFVKQGKQNNLNDEQISKIVDTYKQFKTVDKYSKVVTVDEIVRNDYNLNVPRYVDSFEKEELPELSEVVSDIVKIDEEIRQCNLSIVSMLEQLHGTTPDIDRRFQEDIAPLKQLLLGGMQ